MGLTRHGMPRCCSIGVRTYSILREFFLVSVSNMRCVKSIQNIYDDSLFYTMTCLSLYIMYEHDKQVTTGFKPVLFGDQVSIEPIYHHTYVRQDVGAHYYVMQNNNKQRREEGKNVVIQCNYHTLDFFLMMAHSVTMTTSFVIVYHRREAFVCIVVRRSLMGNAFFRRGSRLMNDVVLKASSLQGLGDGRAFLCHQI